MMKKFLLSLFAVVAGVAAYAGIEVVKAASDMENDNAVVYVKSNANGNAAITKAEPQEGVGKDGSKGISVVSVAGAKDDWDAQLWLMLPEPIEEDGVVVNVKFDYKASAAVTVSTQAHGAPGAYHHWAAIGDIAFGTDWKTFDGKMTVTSDMLSGDEGVTGLQSIAFNLSKDKQNDITFYIDNVELSFEKEVQDPDVIYAWVDVTADEHVTKIEGQGFANASGEITIVSPAKVSEDWDTQVWFVMNEALTENTDIQLTFDAKASSAQTQTVGAHGTPDGLNWKAGNVCNAVNLTEEWQTFTCDIKGKAGWQSFALDLTKATEVTYEFKNIKIQALQQIEQEELVEAITPAFVMSGEEDITLNSHTNVSVEQAEALKVNFENLPDVIGATYSIQEMVMGSDEDGTFFNPGAEVAVGELSVNAIGYAEFDDVLTFAQGKMYQLTVTPFKMVNGDPAEMPSAVYRFNGAYVEEVAAVDLTPDMFHKWSGYDADATVVDENGGSEYALNVSTGLVYGTGSVWGLHYADLSDYDYLVITVTEGTPRCMFNRSGDDGAMPVETPRDAKYQTVEGNVYTIDLAAIVAEYGYAHLQAIKGANWANVNVTEMKLIAETKDTPADVAVVPAFINGEEEITLNDHSNVSVEAAQALKVGFGDNAAKIKHATYVINELVEDEFMGQVSTIEEEVASGTLTMNTFGYVEFDEPLTFYYGHKYNILVKAWDVDENNLFDENWVMVTPIATFTCEFNGATDNTPALEMGEPQIAMRIGSEIEVADWNGLTISFPENNIASALAGTDALEYGAIATIVTDATLSKDGEVVANEFRAQDEDYNSVTVFANETLEGGAAYTIVIPAGGLKVVNQMEYDENWDPKVLWTNAEEITFEFSTAVVKSAEPSFVIGDEEIALNSHSAVSVEGAEGIVVKFENMPEVVGISYNVFQMTPYTDEEGTVWNRGAEIACGEANANTNAYAEFDQALTFYTGNRYLLEVTVYGGNPAEPAEIAVYSYEFNGAAELPTLAAGDYLLQNVATGMYLNGANAWGTKASVTKHGHFFTVAALEDGTYNLDSHIANNATDHFLGTNAYVDAPAAPFAIEFVAEGVWAVKSGDKYLATNDNNTEANFDADDANEAAQWVFVTKNDILDAIDNASEENPVDATALIADANFSRNNNQGFNNWQGDKPGKGGDNANMNAEKWGGNSQEFDSYQEISLPNGTYVLKVQGYYRYNNTTGNTNDIAAATHADGTEHINSYFYANEVEMPLTSIADEASLELCGTMPFSQGEASTAFGKGAYQNELTVKVTNGTLKIGVKKIAHEGCDWTVWDNFELYAIDRTPEIAIIPSLIFGEEEYTLNSHSNVSVDKADAIKVQFENGAAIRNAMYTICEVIADENGQPTYGDDIVSDVLSLNNVGYAEFPEVVTFEAGKQYWVRIMAFGQAADNEEPGQIVVPTAIATFECIVNGSYEPEMAIIPAFVNGDEDITLNSHSEVSVDFAQALKVNVENAPNVLGVSYTIYGMTATESEDGTTWNVNVSDELAAGELSMNAIAYGEFENGLFFEQGKKYQVAVTVYLNNGTETPDEVVEYFVINGSFYEEYAIVPSLMLGEDEVALNSHVNVSVASADALKVLLENCPQAVGGSYAINEMVQVEDENGISWEVGSEIMSDILSVKGFAYADLGDVIYFEAGKKYQLTITLYENAKDPTEIGTFKYEFNGSYEPEIAIIPALIMGEEEMTLNNHSAVSVAEAEAIKVQFENIPGIRNAMYMICEAVVEDGELTYGEEIASDLLSINNIGYAEFDETVKFEYGKQYWVRIMAFGQGADNEEPGQILVPEILATYECLINGAYIPEVVATDLTRDMFHEWDSYEANGNIVGEGGCAYEMGVSTGMPYGNGSVIGAQYADLSKYGTLALTVTEGAPRLLLNRQDMGGSSTDFLEINSASSPYVTVVDNVWYIDLAKIVAEKGYAHLNVIKGANWANVTITEAKLYAETVDVVAIGGVEVAAAKNGKFMKNGKVVIVKNGKTYDMNGMLVK